MRLPSTDAVIDELHQACERRGLTLSRWQTNARKGHDKITWGIHRGERTYRADQVRLIHKVVLHSLEGRTPRCSAYKQLLQLLIIVKGERT